MPTLTSQGTTVTFGSYNIGKVVGLTLNFSSPTKEIRELATNVDSLTGQYCSIYEQTTCEQTFDLETLAPGGGSALSVGIVGKKDTLTIAGQSLNFTYQNTLCESLQVTAKVGDIVRLQLKFKRSFA